VEFAQNASAKEKLWKKGRKQRTQKKRRRRRKKKKCCGALRHPAAWPVVQRTLLLQERGQPRLVSLVRGNSI
jgi:hypothetical protein